MNHRNASFVLKCDVKKFFSSIDHQILLLFVAKKINDEKLLSLVWQIIRSFEHSTGKGLPLGNVTSQLFANIYLNELDQFIKHKLKARYYIRYCDDFVILHQSREILLERAEEIKKFCREFLLLDLHERKTIVRKIHWGTDFLGYVVLPHRVVLRVRTKNRMFRMINNKNLPSYLGLLSHCKSWRLEQRLAEKTQRFSAE
ncbi:MAG: RNA-directed DNA polymerase [Parcubacteria group bacterium Gr01-1014_73]|nr:MAG: RNA-directed DNA polymerase [Parcubacteria group bacterium Gr01-1014_73]